MERRCIYCGTTDDLSKSDIIPDALTNAKIINLNVCREKHNNKFSELFEFEVIERLAIITNELDIKSSKSKQYAPYSVQINVAGTEYNTKISSEIELFRTRKMRSTDGKSLLGPIDEIKKIKNADDKNVTEIDVNQLEIEKKVNLDLQIFFSESMNRMIAKIAFEWYCLQNEVSGVVRGFEPIIQFITEGIGDNIVTSVGNEELYSKLKGVTNFGSHTIFSYVGQDSSVNILVCLFGIAIYNVKVCSFLVDECRSNIIFQELTLDAKRVKFKYDSFENFVRNFQDKFVDLELGNMVKARIPKDITDVTLQYEFMYAINYPLFQADLQVVSEPTEKIINIILKNIEDTLQSSAVTLRGLKRFVKEHFNNTIDIEIKLNPTSTNKKAVFMFYLLFIIGQSNGAIKDLRDLNEVLKEKFSGVTINISDELSRKLDDEIFSLADYPFVILKGAKAVDSWGYD